MKYLYLGYIFDFFLCLSSYSLHKILQSSISYRPGSLLFDGFMPYIVLPLMCSFQPIDKQSLLDSGIFCCLIHVLIALLAYDELSKSKITGDLEVVSAEKDAGYIVLQTRRLEVLFQLFFFQIIIRLDMLFDIVLSYIWQPSLYYTNALSA